MKNEFLNVYVDTYKETNLKIEQGDLEFVGNFKNIAETIKWYTVDFANNVNISKFNEFAA